jgi:hypothetical protein
MKRTQLYLDEEMARLLAAESRRRGTTVSALVRDAVLKGYGRHAEQDRGEIIERLAGVWADHPDLGSSKEFVRRERRSTRPARWGQGRSGKVPPRHRRPH